MKNKKVKFKNLFRKSIAIIFVFIFSFNISNAQTVSGLFVNTIESSGTNLDITVNIAPTYLGATVTTVPNGVAYATIPSSKTVFIDASTSDNFSNKVSASYTVASGDTPVNSAGEITQIFTFPKSSIDNGVSYYFRLRIDSFLSEPKFFESSGTVSSGDFTVVGCGAGFGSDGSLADTSASIPCLIIGEEAGANPILKAEYGKSGTFDLLYNEITVINSILNKDEEKTFYVDFSGLEPNTAYAFRLVDISSEEVFSDDYSFMTTDGNSSNPNNQPGSTGSQYGAGDDTDFNSEEYKQSLVKCNGTPTDPCRFSDLADLINRVVKFLIVMILPLSAILFAYAGFLYLTSAGDTETKGKVKKMLTRAVFGIIIVLSAWLIVKTIFWAVGVESDVNLLDGADQSEDQILNGN